jgi:sigma-B regulation protein RsbU (phosphoserine phosphatase)
VIDELHHANARAACEAACQGLRVLTQFDSGLWGVNVARQLVDLGVPAEQLAGLSWILSVQRMAKLCPRCKRLAPAQDTSSERIFSRYPHLRDFAHVEAPGRRKASTHPDHRFYLPGACPFCNQTGRFGDVAVFDIFHAAAPPPELFGLPSLLPLEAYIFHLAAHGHLPLEDIVHLEANQLRRTYNMLAATENALSEANNSLQRRLAELEAANRVLLQRTEALLSLEEIGQSLIASASLRDLANRVCRRAGSLCGADRVILYYFSDSELHGGQAEVLAFVGWDPARIEWKMDINTLLLAEEEREPGVFLQLPPGVRAGGAGEDEAAVSPKTGLRLPLLAHGNQVGLMIVHSTQKSLFNPGEVALLKTLANQAAVAIQRSGLIEDLRLKIVQLQAAQAELVEKERMRREMELARQVQQSMLPSTFPQVPGYQFSAKNEPARQVGGDFYDVIDLDAGHFAILIADVSDKGMPAALYMALSRSLIIAESRRERSPASVLANLNQLLLEIGNPSQFVSVFYAVIDKMNGLMTYVRAGHERPLFYHGGDLRPLSGDSPILGVLDQEELQLHEEQVTLVPGDRLILYTDGLTDVKNRDGEFFDLPRLVHFLRSKVKSTPDEICRSTFEYLMAYQGPEDQFDDMTMLVLGID